jgi:HAD superfamily hydrolase (TIGR01484 family)
VQQIKKLLIFDIDGTLCNINKSIPNFLLKTLQKVSKEHQIVLASGKPFGYIAGFIRQLGLHNCIVIGENGGTIMYSAIFPPSSYYQIEIPKEVEDIFATIKRSFKKEFSKNIWFQPNDVNLTIFPLKIDNIKQIHKFAKQFESDKINTYYHKDSVDFTPKGFDKGYFSNISLFCFLRSWAQLRVRETILRILS